MYPVISSVSDTAQFSSWLVIQLKPNQLVRSQANLVRQNVEVFMPQIMESVRQGMRFNSMPRPLFPGYLFAKPPLSLSVSALNNTYGVSRVLMRDSKTPQFVPRAVMDWLEAHTGPDGIFIIGANVQPGDTVRLLGGPWAGHVAEVARLKGPERIGVLMKMMGQAVHIDISTRNIAALPDR